MRDTYSFVRKLLGRPIALLGFSVLTVIPIWFFFQMLGLVESGVQQFGAFGYGLLLAVTFLPGFALIVIGMKVSGDKWVLR